MDNDVFGELTYEEDILQDNRYRREGDTLPELSEDEEERPLLADLSNRGDEMSVGRDLCSKSVTNEEETNELCPLEGSNPVGFDLTNRRAKRYFGSTKERESAFRDYSPLDWHLRIGEDELAAKRRRVEVEDAVGRLTLRILASRMASQQKGGGDTGNCIGVGQQIYSNRENGSKAQRLLRLPPMDGRPWWGVSSIDGLVRRYVSIRKKQPSQCAQVQEGAVDSFATDAFYSLLEQMEEQENQHENIREDADVQNISEENRQEAKKGVLWTDKYAPSTFLDLLTEDETNRIVLIWLRLWEESTFAKNQRGRKQPLWDSLDEKSRALFEMEPVRGSEGKLPKQKILALYGPSGVGKSALAQVAALQAGYRPVRIAISELQNVADLRARLENATDSNGIDAIFKQNVRMRPCCFVVEGLEMAQPELVQFMGAWVRRTQGKGAALRRRPIICTCASLWNGTNMKDLRALAFAVRVQQCNRERLHTRLEQICQRENLPIGRVQIVELLNSHGSDMRLCLNSLQFLSFTAKSTRNETNFCVPNSGTVNTAASVPIFDVLTAIFTLDFHEDGRGIVRSPAERARTLLSMLAQLPHDDFARLQQLVFTNFVAVLKLSSTQCRRVCALFVQLDRLQSLVQRAQHYGLARYAPFAILLVHFHCSVHVSRRFLSFSMAAPPFSDRLREHQQIVRSLRHGAAQAQHYLGSADMQWLLPHLYLVLQPPIPPTMWSQEQRLVLRRVVELMRVFRLLFVHKFGGTDDGSNGKHCFDPAFDALTRFPLFLPALTVSMPETSKQYIVQQLELPINAGEHLTDMKEVDGNIRNGRDEGGEGKSPENEKSSKPSTFASFPDKRPTASATSAGLPVPFTFRHSAGSSQAVRRDIPIGSLFALRRK